MVWLALAIVAVLVLMLLALVTRRRLLELFFWGGAPGRPDDESRGVRSTPGR